MRIGKNVVIINLHKKAVFREGTFRNSSMHDICHVKTRGLKMMLIKNRIVYISFLRTQFTTFLDLEQEYHKHRQNRVQLPKCLEKVNVIWNGKIIKKVYFLR